MASTDEDLDAILDQALDDLEQVDAVDEIIKSKDKGSHDKVEASSTTASSRTPRAPRASTGLAMDPQQFMQFFMENEEGGEEAVKAKLEDFAKQIGSAVPEAKGKSKVAAKTQKETTRPVAGPPRPPSDEDDVAASLASILEQMKTMDHDNFEDEMAAGGLNPDAIVDGMMEQLLSKDLMYEPMKQVADQFPAWLEEKKDTLSEGDLAKYRKQFKCFKDLVDQYESDPSNTEQLMQLMQEAQEFGQPPEEIVKSIAPGLDLDDEGMPKMNPFDAFGEGGEECLIM